MREVLGPLAVPISASGLDLSDNRRLGKRQHTSRT